MLDGAVTVLDAQNGVEPQTENVWRQATEMHVPRLVFANKMDKMGADFAASVDSIKQRLGVKATAIQWPIGAEADFNGIIDLVTMKAYQYDGKQEENPVEIEIPADLKDIAELKRAEMIEDASEFDEELWKNILRVLKYQLI